MNTGKSTDFGKEASRLLPVIQREGMRELMPFLSDNNLTIQHVVVLELLKESGTHKMGDIAKALNLTMSAVTVIIDKMIEMELVSRERSESDRRVVNVMLEKKGNKFIEEFSCLRRGIIKEMFSHLTGEEKEEYLRLLRKVCQGLNR